MGNLWRLPFIFGLGALTLSLSKPALAGWSQPIHDLGMEYRDKVSEIRDEAQTHVGTGDEKLQQAQTYINNAHAASNGVCPPNSPANMCTTGTANNGQVLNASIQKWQGDLAVSALNTAIAEYDAAMSTADRGIEKADEGREKVDDKWNEVHEGACKEEEGDKRDECFEHIQKERELRKDRLSELKASLGEIKTAADEKKRQAESMRDAAQTIVLAATAALTTTATQTSTSVTQTGTVVSTSGPGAPNNGFSQNGENNTSTNGTSTLSSTSTNTDIADDADDDRGNENLFDNSAGAASGGNALASSNNSRSNALEGCFSGSCLNGKSNLASLGRSDSSSYQSSSSDGRRLASNRGGNGIIVQNVVTVTDSEGTQLQLFPMASLAYAGCPMNQAELGCQLQSLARAEALRQQRARLPASTTSLPIVNR